MRKKLVIGTSLFLLACGGKSNAPKTEETPALATKAAEPPAKAAEPSTTVAPTQAESARKAVAQKQGESYWGVYLAQGTDGGSPEMKAAKENLTALGLEFGNTFGEGALSCDEGAADALKLPAETIAMAAYFATEDDAKAFAASLSSTPIGIAKIKAMCRD
jgi:hypothetical protein